MRVVVSALLIGIFWFTARGCLSQQAQPFSLCRRQSLCVGQGKTAVLLKSRVTRHFNYIIQAQRNKRIFGLGSRT